MNGFRWRVLGTEILGLVILLGACSSARDSSTSVVKRGSRLLGLDWADTTENGDYGDNTTLAKTLPAEATTLALQWNEIETGVSTYTDPDGALGISEAYYPAHGLKLSLTIRSIDTVSTPVPADLAGTDFDDSAMATRYNALLDWVFTQIPSVDLVSLQIGNEIDLNADSAVAGFWSRYQSFVSAVAAHVHTVRPGTPVGFTVTAASAWGDFKTEINDAASDADLMGVTYYPLNDDFTVKDPSEVASDFEKFVTAFARDGRTVYLQEVGYPSDAANGSSAAQQAEFFAQVFKAWDTYASKIPFLSIVRLVDYSSAAAQSTANDYGLGGDAKFVSYLQTLGLRTYDGSGSNKDALTTLQEALKARSW